MHLIKKIICDFSLLHGQECGVEEEDMLQSLLFNSLSGKD